jgi:ubiquinone biosynthesis protein COQ9
MTQADDARVPPPAPDASAPDAIAPDVWARETEQRVLDAALVLAPRLGWTRAMVLKAGAAAGLSAPETELLVPNGAADLAALLSRRHDAAALEALAALDPQAMKIRARVRAAVAARLDADAADLPAVRRLVGFLALPQNAGLGMRLQWESADALWRWAGDTATDENHYSKRAILAGVLTGAVAILMQSGRDAALTFVDARIENIMAFERWKAKLKPSDLLRQAASALGRMRYG